MTKHMECHTIESKNIQSISVFYEQKKNKWTVSDSTTGQKETMCGLNDITNEIVQFNFLFLMLK